MQHYRTAQSLLPAIPVPGIASRSASSSLLFQPLIPTYTESLSVAFVPLSPTGTTADIDTM